MPVPRPLMAWPCLFCDKGAQEVIRDPNKSSTAKFAIYWVECQVCAARGPESESPEEAMRTWNYAWRRLYGSKKKKEKLEEVKLARSWDSTHTKRATKFG